MWERMKFYHYFPFVTFVVLTADQFAERYDGRLEQQKLNRHICQRNRTFSLIFRQNLPYLLKELFIF